MSISEKTFSPKLNCCLKHHCFKLSRRTSFNSTSKSSFHFLQQNKCTIMDLSFRLCSKSLKQGCFKQRTVDFHKLFLKFSQNRLDFNLFTPYEIFQNNRKNNFATCTSYGWRWIQGSSFLTNGYR